MNNFYLILFVLITGIPLGLLHAQDTKITKFNNDNQRISAEVILKEVEDGIAKSNVGAIFKHLSPQTYFSLTNGIRGYYSSNQAYYILEDFFNVYRAISFKFHSIQVGEDSPYATGIYAYEFKGKRETAQVYISLKISGKSWKIIQITFN